VIRIPDCNELLLLVPPMKPFHRPIDLIYTKYERSLSTSNLLPVQIGLLSIASYLREDGFSCQYYDLSHFQGKPTLKRTLTELLKKYDPCIVGLTSYTSNFNATLKCVEILKDLNPNLLVCVGGPHVTFLDRLSLEESNFQIDVIVRGEGERTFRSIVYHYFKGHDLEQNVRGITTKTGRSADQKPLTNEELTNLPPLAFDLIPQNERKKQIYIPINISRGCVYKCSFCTNSLFWGHSIRLRDPEKVVEEILIAEELFPNIYLEFTDTILPFNLSQFEKLVALYTKEINTPASMAFIRANLVNNRRLELLKKLIYEYGYVTVGVENSHPKILKIMNKPTWETQLSALQKLRKFALMSIPTWIIGFCGENLPTMLHNLEIVDYLNKTDLVDSIIMFIWVPLPGSLPFQNPKQFGLKLHTLNWDQYDRAIFPPPYSLYDPQTGKPTLTNLQIWAYFLSMVTLQNSWDRATQKIKERNISMSKFLKIIEKNQKYQLFSTFGESNINIYKDLLPNLE